MIEKFVQTVDKDFVRDITSGALINTNAEGLQERKMRKQQMHRLDRLESNLEKIISVLSDVAHRLEKLETDTK